MRDFGWRCSNNVGHCRECLLENLARSQFIPAYVENQFVDAIYVEVVSRKTWGRLVVK